MVKIGDWVTQYSAGYWQIVDVIPKYDEDEPKGFFKKKQQIGFWAIVKKGLTPKMKPSNLCECIDISWCQPVSDDIASEIEKLFKENPKALEKFQNAPSKPNPCISSVWLNIPEKSEAEFSKLLSSLPEKFTMDEFWKVAKDFKGFVSKPPTTHILNFETYPWELDNKYNTLYFNPTVKTL